MKAVSLTQPYATLIALGAKKIETRSWRTDYRGPLAIHAAKGLGPVGGRRGLRDLCCSGLFFTALVDTVRHTPHKSLVGAVIDALPLGAIVAVCNLRGCVATELIVDSGQAIDGDTYTRREGLVTHTTFIPNPDRRWDLTDQERAFGDYSPGRYAWLLADVKMLPEPILAKGALSLWEWEGEL